MTTRRLAILATAIAVPAAVVALVAGPLLNAPQASPPRATGMAASADTPGLTGSPTSTLAPTTTPAPTYAPEPIARTISVTERRVRGPIGSRIFPAGVWTGEEVIVWGGLNGGRVGAHEGQPTGAAYDPKKNRWRRIAPAPIPNIAGAHATWTGQEMLILGRAPGAGERPGPTGAAYDPDTDSWRRIADPPIRPGPQSATLWTGDEWIFATPRGRADAPTDIVHYVAIFAAYDPDADTWRRLPDIGPLGSVESDLLAAGSELLLVNGASGLYRLRQGASEWIPSSDVLLGQELDDVTSIEGRIFGVHPRLGVMEWNAPADTWNSIAVPPYPVSGITAVGNELLVLDAEGFGMPAFAFHLETGELWALSWPESEDRIENVRVWADDRLFVWGGWGGHPSGRPPGQGGFLYTPEW